MAYLEVKKDILDLGVIDNVLTKMNKEGIKVNKELFDEQIKKCSLLLEQLKEEWGNELDNLEVAGFFDIDNPKQVKSLFFSELEFPLVEECKVDGYPSLNPRNLKIYSELFEGTSRGELVRIYSDFIKNNRLLNFYNSISKLLKDRGKEGFFIYPHYSIRAITGKISTEGKIIMSAIPKAFKEVLIPREEGTKFYSFSYSHLEYILVSYLANIYSNKELEEEFLSSVDGDFLINLSNLLDIDSKLVKEIYFSLIFGGDTLYKSSLTKGAKIFELISSLRNKVILDFKEKGYLETIYGLEIPVSLIPRESMIFSSFIEGSVADIIKKAIQDINGFIKDKNDEVKLVSVIHDTLIFEIKESPNKDKIVEAIKEKMINVDPNFKLEVSILEDEFK